MGPSLHQGCEKAGRHSKESSLNRHWTQETDCWNCHMYLDRLGMAPLISLTQSPETEHPPQGPNWKDSFASAGPYHSPAANHQEPSRQANGPNRYIYGYILHKLEHVGVRGLPLNWFKSYLTNRKQYVHVNGADSSLRNMTCVVPQGSVLGPLHFFYIHE